MNDLQRLVLAQIKEEECVALIKKLVPAGQPEAENPADPDLPSGREEKVALVVAEELEGMGLEVQLTEAVKGRPNVIGLLKGVSGQPNLLLNDHLDTYPAGDCSEWTKTNFAPYQPTVIGRKVYGRGTSDTRGNMACQLLAVKAIIRAGIILEGDLQMTYTVDEERNGFSGARYLVEERNITADFGIVSEPTSLTEGDDWVIGIAVANCGHCFLEVETRGTKVHIWRPDTGLNAITQMEKLLQQLEKLELTHNPPKIHSAVSPTLCVVRIDGGKIGEGSFIPDKCTARVAAVGLVPGMTPLTVIDDINSVIDSISCKDRRFEATVRELPGHTFIPATKEIPETAAHVKAISKAYEEITSKKPTYYRKVGYNDTIIFTLNNIPSITFGPGEDAWEPINEYIDIDKALIATKIYALTIMDLLNAVR